MGQKRDPNRTSVAGSGESTPVRLGDAAVEKDGRVVCTEGDD